MTGSHCHAGEWETSANFCCARDFVRIVKVVNDAAERGVKLIIDCAAIMTDDVQQKHDLLQAIEAHREQFPDFAKATLEKTFS